MAFIESKQIITGLHRGEVGVLQSLPNGGKSTLVGNLAMCAAIGREFPPLLIKSEPRRVVLIDFENRSASLHRDLINMSQGGVLSEEELALLDTNLTILVDEQIEGVEMKLSDASHAALVNRRCRDLQADLIIVDTMAAAFSVQSENDNSEMNRTVLIPFQKLLRDSGAAGLLVHHVGKFGESDNGKVYRSRGASVIAAYARLVLDLSKDRNEEDCVILNCAKIKGQRFDDTILRLDREARWFRLVQDVEPSQSSYEKLVNLVTREMLTAEIIDLASSFISRPTVEALLSKAVKRGALTKTGRGKYAPISQ